MTSPSDEQRRYSGDLISASLYASPVLGVKGNRFIIDSLQDRGMRLDSKHRYSLSEIKSFLEEVFGTSFAAGFFETLRYDLLVRTEHY